MKSELAQITLAYWRLSSSWEGRIETGITVEDGLHMTEASRKHLNPERRVARCMANLQQQIITGNPIADKVAADAS